LRSRELETLGNPFVTPRFRSAGQVTPFHSSHTDRATPEPVGKKRPSQEGRTLSARFGSRCRVRPCGQVLNELSCERCNVSGNVVGIPPTHCKIHLCVRAHERGHEVVFIKSVFSTNYLKRRRVCDDAPETSANDVARRATILSYMPPTLNISGERHSRHKGQHEANSKTNSITSHKFPLNQSSVWLKGEADREQALLLPFRFLIADAPFTSSKRTPPSTWKLSATRRH
jgi:hypothetical protein